MNGRIVVRIVCVFALVSVLVAGILPSAVLAKDDKPVVPPFDPVVFGELAAKWSQWVYAQPMSVNPLLDTTGEYCAVGQSGPVWFLAGTPIDPKPIVRTCTVPADVQLFFPILNVTYIGFQSDPLDTEEQARNVAHWYVEYLLEGSRLFAQIDGMVFLDEELRANYRVDSLAPTSPIFGVAVPDDNIIGIDPVETCSPERICSPSAADGIFLLVDPLTPGKHTIMFYAKDMVKVVYKITVLPPGEAGTSATSAASQPILYLPVVQP